MIITLFKVGKDGATCYYTLHDRQPLLDSPFSLCASWRKGLGKERERMHRFDSLLEKDRLIRRLISARLKDGYKILYTFARPGEAADGPRSAGPEPLELARRRRA